MWPDELVLGYSETDVINRGIDGGLLFSMVQKNSNSLVVVVRKTITYSLPHTFDVFGTPSAPPREILDYTPF